MKRNLFTRTVILATLLALTFGALGAPPAQAAPLFTTFTINTTADTIDANIGNGLCADASGNCSLRAAISEANFTAGSDTINLPAGTYTLTQANTGGVNEDNNLTGDLDINASLTIQGAGSGSTIIQAGTNTTNGIDKVFGVNPICNPGVSVVISGVTIRYGRNTQAYGAADYSYTGGGLDWCGGGGGGFTLSNAVVSDNTNVNGYGGGVCVDSISSDTINITNVTFQNNKTMTAANQGQGGGLNIYGYQPNVTIAGSQFINNSTANPGSSTGGGGGIYYRPSYGGSLTIHNTTISGNTAGGYGGGVYVGIYNSTTLVTIDQGTQIVNNVSGGVSGGNAGGGGIIVDGFTLTSAPIVLSKITVSSNSESSLSGTRIGGGGIYVRSANVVIAYSRIVNNTVLSSNGGSGLYKDTSSGTVTATNNWWGCSTGPSAEPCDTAVIAGGSSGSLTSSPYLRLLTTSSPSTAVVNQSNAVIASFRTNSSGADVSGNLDRMIGLPVSWSAPGGTLSGQQTTIQSNGTATANYQAATIGTGQVSARVDNDTTTSGKPNVVSIAVNKANTTTAITSDAPDPSPIGQALTVNYTVTGEYGNSPTAPTGNVTVSDGVNSCTGTVAAGSCSITLTTVGARSLTASYAGDANFNASSSQVAPHTVRNNVISGNADIANVTIAYAGGSTVTDSSGDYSFEVGYDWSGTVVPSLMGYTFTPSSRSYSNVTSDQTAQDYAAALNTYTLTYTAGANGTISGTSPQTVNYGADGTQVTAVPDTGYHFFNWSDASTVNPRTDMNVTTNISVAANYAVNTYTLTYDGNGNTGGVTPSDSASPYAHGATVTILGNTGALTKTGYAFAGWNTQADGLGATYAAGNAFTITANTTLYAQWHNLAADFVITVKTDAAVVGNAQFTIPIYSGATYNYNVDCDNDGIDEAAAQHSLYACAYATPGTYTIRIKDNSGAGTGFPRIYFYGSSFENRLELLAVEQWGTGKWTSMYRAFYGCSNLAGQATDSPDLSGVTDLSYMFRNASVFNQDIGNWNTGNVTNMTGMFYDAGAFNQDIGNWNTANVTDMSYMFTAAGAFNQEIGNWNTGNVGNMNGMFYGASAFNQNLGSWNVGSLTNATDMFTGATLSTANYDALLNGWSVQTLKPGVTFNGGNSRYCAGETARANMTAAPNSWSITDGGKGCFTLTYTAGEHGSLTGTSPQTVNYGASGAEVTAVADPGYYFVQWSDDSTANPRTDINVTGDVNVTATFAPESVLDVTSAHGTVTPDKAGPYHYGDVVQLTVLPETGWEFSSWSGDLSGAENPGTLTITGNAAVTANYTQTEYSLTVISAHGTVNRSQESPYHYGDIIQLTAIPDLGWTFANWSDDASGTDNSTSVTMDGAKVVAANYAPIEYSLTVNSAHGTVTLSPDQVTYHYGDVVTLSVTPDTGWAFSDWSPSLTDNKVTITDHTIVTANFAIHAYTLTYAAGEHGSITGTSPQMADYGASGTEVTAVADTNYHFVDWSDGVLTAARTDTSVTADVNVTANFAINTYAVSYDANAADSGTVPGEQVKTHDVTLTLATNSGALAKTGYTFNGWNTQADGYGTHYDAGADYVDNAPITLYAQWIDTPPTVVSSMRADANPTNATSVHFTITFSEAVTGVGKADFGLWSGTLAGTSVTSVSGSGTTYTVIVNAGTGSGSLRLLVKDDNSIKDVAGNPLNGTLVNDTYTSGEFYTIDRTPPAAVSIVRASPNPTKAASVDFTVTFSEAVTNVTDLDFELAGTGKSDASITGVSGSGKTYIVTVNTGGSGTLGLDLTDRDTIVDLAGNPLNGGFTGALYDVDKTPPTVVSSLRADANPTNAGSVRFTVTFSEMVTGVDKFDFGLWSGTLSGTSVTGVSGSGTTYTVTVNTGTGSGSLRLIVKDNNSIVDGLKNPLNGATVNTTYVAGEYYTVNR